MYRDLYLSLADQKRIALYQRNPTSGALEAVGSYEIDADPIWVLPIAL